MPQHSKNLTAKKQNLEKANIARHKSLGYHDDKNTDPSPPPHKKKMPSHSNMGYTVNRKYSRSPIPLVTTTSSFKLVRKKRGNFDLLLYGLKTMAEILDHHPEMSLTAASEEASHVISTVYDTLYCSKTLRNHYKRIVEHPEFYDGKNMIFPARLGNSPTLSFEEVGDLVQLLDQRIKNKSLIYPTIRDFIEITFDFCGHKYTKSWMSSFLKNNGFTYGPPIPGKVGTRYHDSDLILSERIQFLLRKIWYISWERVGKVELYVHDESWINEKPSGTSVWSSERVGTRKKIEGRRFAFASLWCVNTGLLANYPFLNNLDNKIRSFKGLMDVNSYCSLENIFDYSNSENIVPVKSISVNKSNKLTVPLSSNSIFFYFDVKTASQNKGVVKQMDSSKFLQSIEHMIRQVLRSHPKDRKLVLQLDNATYHRVPSDPTIRSVVDVYPRNRRDGTKSLSMLCQLKLWGRKPPGQSEQWWNPIKSTLGRISKTKSKSQIDAISRQRESIKAHKNWIRRFYHTVPEVRSQKTLVDALCEKLSLEYQTQLDCPIEILWGARGHSELAEIEHSWNFMKNWTKSMNPMNAKETTSLMHLSVVLDSVNSRSWRNRIILVIDCYFTDGYFSQELLRKKYSDQASVLKKWDLIFNEITSRYSFSPSGFSEYCLSFTTKFVKQLSYAEIKH